MADFEPPSFSLGLDLDPPDSNAQTATATINNSPPSILLDDDDDFETLTVVDSDSEDRDSVPKLKRLRRGSAVSLASGKSVVDLQASVVVDDDDIEDFSSPEDNCTG
ncbi:hypothetical protein Hdeb2414_s0018g00520931 [Helianthus debilis subsp. tardiflorus]